MGTRAEPTTLRAAVFPASGASADVVTVVAGAALIAVCAQVSIALPFTPVPITGQTFAVLLVGFSFGAIRGGASSALYVLAGIAGAPVYAHAGSGWAVVAGASGGYLLAFPIASALTGWLAERRWDRRFPSALAAMLTGNVVIYVVGLAWLARDLHTNLEKTFELGLYPFVAGDLLKLYLAAVVLPTGWRLAGRRDRR